MTSNGSTSMASTCGSTLALMDAGVPIKAPVAGAAMGLITEPDGRFVVLTDILGKEDAIGDMDFKVTGTRDGVTALQMDIKVQGISEAIIRDGLKQALAARLTILDKMAEVLPEARAEMSDFAPRIITIKINPEKIREIIGKGGSMIRKIQEETQTEINVEDDGTVEIAAVSGENSRKAIQWIESLTREVEIGALYLGKVTRIMGFGAFVEILPGKEGLVRIGELADYHVPTVEDVVSVGDEVMVVVHRDRSPGPRQPLAQGGHAAPPGQGTRLRLATPGGSPPGSPAAQADRRSLGSRPVVAFRGFRPCPDARTTPGGGAASRLVASPPGGRAGAAGSRWYTPAVPDQTQSIAEPCPHELETPHRRGRRRHRRRRSDDGPDAPRARFPGRGAAAARLRALGRADRRGRRHGRTRSGRRRPSVRWRRHRPVQRRRRHLARTSRRSRPQRGATVIDNSSAWRMDPSVPLVVSARSTPTTSSATRASSPIPTARRCSSCRC